MELRRIFWETKEKLKLWIARFLLLLNDIQNIKNLKIIILIRSKYKFNKKIQK